MPPTPTAPALDPATRAEIARAARVLFVRGRRDTGGWLAGGYRSAFRGGGMEFEESRPYAPGDDVRSIDWNATARTGEPWVKRFREERLQTVLLALDVSGSMRFGTTGRTKAALAAHAASLLAAAAGRAGDRVGLVAFADGVRAAVPPGRGAAHTWRVVRESVAAAAASAGATELGAALAWIERHARRRAVVVVLSDWRAPRDARDGSSAALHRLGVLARRHDVVAAVLEDPRERALVPAGSVRITDPERSGRPRVLRTGSARARERYASAARAHRRALLRDLRRSGIEPVLLSTAGDPVRALARLFHARARRSGAGA